MPLFSVSPKRIIVIESIFEAFKKKVYNLVKTYHTGNPFDENCMIGPMARADLRKKIHQQIQTSIDLGAECLIGGYFEDKVGYYYAPTLLANVKPGMPAFDNELFGPVVSLIQAEDERDAISLANQSCYGLGSGVFSKDINKAEKILTNHLHVGLGKINGLVYSDPKLPFGGVKGSGFGRECGTLGLQEFANIKTIIV
jgi:succinate-semialdehyde dehydrogenase/glutarate-semialdehyde dehydrogenase